MRPLTRDLVGGAILGAIVLGVGGRLAMREITLVEGRAHIASVVGTLTVVAGGAGFGLIAGAVRAGVDRWLGGWPVRRRALLFAVLCVAIALTILTPWTVSRLALFTPLVLVFAAAFERWRAK